MGGSFVCLRRVPRVTGFQPAGLEEVDRSAEAQVSPLRVWFAGQEDE
jgi:hypothetical protein